MSNKEIAISLINQMDDSVLEYIIGVLEDATGHSTPPDEYDYELLDRVTQKEKKEYISLDDVKKRYGMKQ